jgi:hypothetical protein
VVPLKTRGPLPLEGLRGAAHRRSRVAHLLVAGRRRSRVSGPHVLRRVQFDREAADLAPSAFPAESRLPKPHVQLSQLLRTKVLNPLFARPGSRWFSRPVSSKQFPHYRDVISKPIDLSTIGRRLDQYKYRSPVDILSDFDLIASNAAAFNGADHAIAKEAAALAAAARAAYGQ